MGRDEIESAYEQQQQLAKEKPAINVLSNIVMLLAIYGLFSFGKLIYHLIKNYL